MKKFSTTLIGFLTLLGFEGLFTSCEKIPSSLPIRINVVNTSTKAGSGYVAMQGETVTSSLESNGFVLDAYVDDDYSDFSTTPKVDYQAGLYIDSDGSTNVTKSSKWDISGTPTWVSDVKTQFWAHYPASMKGSIIYSDVNSPYTTKFFSYTMPTANGSSDASNNFDDPVFSHVEQKFTGSNEVVNMTFHHALSQIRFFVNFEDSDVNKWDGSIKLTKVELKAVRNSGNCSFNSDNTFTWTDQSGNSIFGQNLGVFTSSDWQDYTIGSYSGKLCNHAFFVVPQSTSGISIRVTFSDGVNTAFSEKEIPTDTWYADNYYTYKLAIKGYALADITLVSANASHEAYDQLINLEY